MKYSCSPFLMLTLGLLASACGADRSGNETHIDDLHLPDLNRLFEEYERVDSLETYAGFARKIDEANRDLRASELYVEAAALYDLAGDSQNLAKMLHKAIDNGMANPNILDKFKNVPGSEASAIWARLKTRLDSIERQVSRVENFSLEVDAMEKFWEYFERAEKDRANAKSILKEFIFRGPRELRDFYVVRYLSTEAMYGQMINASPKYYTYLRRQFNADSLRALNAITTAWMHRFKEIYPQAVFPKVYVVPGILNSGGTATEMGLFVGGDMYGKSAGMPTDELTEWQRNSIMKFSSLPGLTIHELMHFQQNYRDNVNRDNVLFKVIEEGVCDFLVELVSQVPMTGENLSYLEKPGNMDRILSDLRQDMFTDDLSRWMYNGGSISDRPHDLGYTLGYLITKSYYANMVDKQKAVYELLNTESMNMILEGSDYSGLMQDALW